MFYNIIKTLRKEKCMYQEKEKKDTSIDKKKNGRPMKEKKKKQYTLTMDEELHDEIVKNAENMELSFSSYVSMILKTYMQKGE